MSSTSSQTSSNIGVQRIGSEFQVNTYTDNNQAVALVAGFSNGNFVVTWTSLQDGSGQGIYAQLFDGNANRIGNEFQVNTYTTDYQQHSSVASFSNGNFVVTWHSNGQDGSSRGVYGQLFYGNTSKLSNEFQVNTYTISWQEVPRVASFSNGNFVVAWESDGQDGSLDGVYGQLFDGNATRIGNEFQINTYTNNLQHYISASSFSNDNFGVAWQSNGQDGSGWGAYGQLFDSNASRIGNEFQINSYIINDQSYPSSATLNNGNFAIAWKSNGQDGSGDGIYGQVFDGSASRIGNEFQINTYTTDNQQYPRIASFSSGDFVVTWDSCCQDGSLRGIYGQLFYGNGTKLGSEFQVNTYTDNNQIEPSVATLNNGNFVVTWYSYGQDGSEGGIYGQLFESPFIASSTTSTTSEILNSTSLPSSSTDVTISSSSSNPITTNNQLSSTFSTTSTSSIPTPFTITLEETSVFGNNSSVLWIGLGAILLCIGGTGGAIAFILKKRKEPEKPVELDDFKLKPKIEKSYKKIGEKYYQLSGIKRAEANKIYNETGYSILFPPLEQKKSLLFLAKGILEKSK